MIGLTILLYCDEVWLKLGQTTFHTYLSKPLASQIGNAKTMTKNNKVYFLTVFFKNMSNKANRSTPHKKKKKLTIITDIIYRYI